MMKKGDSGRNFRWKVEILYTKLPICRHTRDCSYYSCNTNSKNSGSRIMRDMLPHRRTETCHLWREHIILRRLANTRIVLPSNAIWRDTVSQRHGQSFVRAPSRLGQNGSIDRANGGILHVISFLPGDSSQFHCIQGGSLLQESGIPAHYTEHLSSQIIVLWFVVSVIYHYFVGVLERYNC